MLSSSPSAAYIHKDIEIASIDKLATKPRVWLCFRTRSQCITRVLSILIVLSTTLAITVYFLWPRLPIITLSTPYTLQSTPIQINSTAGETSLIFTVYVNASIVSANYINYHVALISLAGSLLVTDPKLRLAGSGNVTDLYVLAKQSTTLVLPIVFVKTVAGSRGSLFADPAIQSLLSACGASGGTKTPLTIAYEAKVNVDGIKQFYTPVVDGTDSIACPLSLADIKTLVGGTGNV